MKHRSCDMGRRRAAAYHKGRRDLADDILALLRGGGLDAVQERLRAEVRRESSNRTKPGNADEARA